MTVRTAGFVVIAEFAVSPERRKEFLELCAFDSLRSTSDEPGCRQFDVSASNESPEVVILYEVYDDRDAFEKHLTMPHYAVFADGVKRLEVNKTLVRFLERQYPTGDATLD
jgi:autoinducer 2-degrading protein